MSAIADKIACHAFDDRQGMGLGIVVVRKGLPQAFSLIVVPPDFVAEGAPIPGSVDPGEVGLVFHRLWEPVRFWVRDAGFHVTGREQDFVAAQYPIGPLRSCNRHAGVVVSVNALPVGAPGQGITR